MNNQVVAETNVGSQEVANETDAQQPQTLYVAIQPGANMESGQGDQPAVYLEVVEAGSGTEVTSSDGQVNLVQEEMVIDNGNWQNIHLIVFPKLFTHCLTQSSAKCDFLNPGKCSLICFFNCQ